MNSPYPDNITVVYSEQFLRKLFSIRKLRYKYRKQIKEVWARLEAEKKGENIEETLF